MRAAPSIVLTEKEQTTLERWARGRVTEARRVQRARIVLEASQRRTNTAIAETARLANGNGGLTQVALAAELGSRHPTYRLSNCWKWERS